MSAISGVVVIAFPFLCDARTQVRSVRSTVAGSLRSAAASTSRRPCGGPRLDRRCGRSGSASADDRDVVLTHARQAVAAAVRGQGTLLFPGIVSGMSLVDGNESAGVAIAAAPDQVAPRLKRLRAQRQITLTSLADTEARGTHVPMAGDRAALPERGPFAYTATRTTLRAVVLS